MKFTEKDYSVKYVVNAVGFESDLEENISIKKFNIEEYFER